MMEQPVRIGITTYATNEQGEYVLPQEYVAAVRRAGALPILFPPGESRIDELLESVDAMILAGGGDICPSRYGGQPHDSLYMVDATRDQMEIEIARRLLQLKMPTLAICRGIQTMNVACGGTLYPHIPDIYGDKVQHRAPPRKPIPHPVQLATGSRLAKIMGVTSVSTMSWHHQAIQDLAAGAVPTAFAADGVIEAMEMPDHPQVIAVQWHPELTDREDVTQQKLFDYLVTLVQDSGSIQ